MFAQPLNALGRRATVSATEVPSSAPTWKSPSARQARMAANGTPRSATVFPRSALRWIRPRAASSRIASGLLRSERAPAKSRHVQQIPKLPHAKRKKAALGAPPRARVRLRLATHSPSTNAKSTRAAMSKTCSAREPSASIYAAETANVRGETRCSHDVPSDARLTRAQSPADHARCSTHTDDSTLALTGFLLAAFDAQTSC